jgi:hypothetical protein
MSTGSKHSEPGDLGMRRVIIYGALAAGFLLFGLRMLDEEPFWPLVAIPSFLSCALFTVGAIGEWRKLRRGDASE